MLLEVAGVTVKFTLQQLCIWTVEARWLNLTLAKMEGKFTWRRQCRWKQGGAGGGDTGNRGKPLPGKYLEIFNIQERYDIGDTGNRGKPLPGREGGFSGEVRRFNI